MTPQRINMALAVIFLIVGILATVNTFRLNAYIRDTLPRDQAQEDCNAAQLKAMNSWVVGREDRDRAADKRADVVVLMLDMLAKGERPGPPEIEALREAELNEQQAREDAIANREELPVKC